MNKGKAPPNQALHWTGIPLRSIPASELGRYTSRYLPEEEPSTMFRKICYFTAVPNKLDQKVPFCCGFS